MPEIDIVWIAAGAGGALLLLIIIILVVASGGKKKKAEKAKALQPSPQPTSPQVKPPSKPAPAAPAAAPSSAPARGLDLLYSLDVVGSEAIGGWVMDKAAPALRLDVTVLAGESVVGKAKADAFRQDLKDAGTGDGTYAFHFPLSRKLQKGERVRILASVGKSDQVLMDAPFAGD
jgi:hypothetical protein